ncbi:hypothetical protein [Castellaniella sp.]|uniref:hypothetical protein n=1 Tax=Castellaniella sp. TaxID=1955812 RepID=UPI002AFEA609|nr:hypothetical protein [Castellaniella sp.]
MSAGIPQDHIRSIFVTKDGNIQVDIGEKTSTSLSDDDVELALRKFEARKNED